MNNPNSPAGHARFDRHIAAWLLACAVVVFAMVVLGGLTRLTHSGLSMVDWQPVMGVIPPLTESEWQSTFEQYKRFPEYQKVNVGMDLDGFKSIFWFEYAHRLLGRGIGVIFVVPLIYFVFRRQVQGALSGKLLGLLILGGLQGLMGWYMVKSGLVDNPMVSQYRLTAHLALAVIVFGAMLWVALDLLYPGTEGKHKRDVFALVTVAIVFFTMMSGGFVAGTRAGLLFGTWPLMGDSFFPAGLFTEGIWHSSFEDPVTIQFNHRLLAYLTSAVMVWFAVSRLRMHPPVQIRIGVWLMLAALISQVLLGVVTILFGVPVALAASHQGVALLLLGSTIFVLHRSASPR